MLRLITPLVVAAFCQAQTALAAAPSSTSNPEEELAAAKRLADGLKYRQGEITLKDGLARIKLPETFRYLDDKDSQTVLSKIWSNPPTPTLGMLVPADFSPIDPESWAVIITYQEDGYVKDNDAAEMDYDDILKKLQAGMRESNKERERQGYPGLELVGWAAPPRYDATAHKMYWARDLKSLETGEHTLNYNIRMLGRAGVLVLNAVAQMDKLSVIEQSTPTILGMVDFQEGHRYTDFNAKTDKVATYGLIGLIAGGVLAKVGFFKGLLVAALALKKFVIVAVVAAGAAIKKFFAKITGKA